MNIGNIVGVVVNAAEVLKYLADEGMGQLKAICEKLQLPKSTTHRLLRSLEASGLVSSNGKGLVQRGKLVKKIPGIGGAFISLISA